ncbi:MAG: exonuclease domain-containing protein [Ignavibacteria bacterium]|nr:exonuclease domain-containing protein [Ignavibacteria bacterium]
MLSIWDTNFIVVDVETTGTNPEYGRIIEIACVIVNDGTIKGEFVSLVNPRQHIPNFISQMTGITNEMVFQAPGFEEIIDKIQQIFELKNSVFVAHNVNFDYNFVKKSFERIGKKFPDLPKLCTLKLARRLITGINKKNVGSLSEYLGISIKNRHRAFGDARATAQILLELLEIAENEHNITNLEELLQFQYKNFASINIPQKLLFEKNIEKAQIPDTPGVYYFIDKNDKILYIGKAKSLRKRLQSYFNFTFSKKILRLLRATKKIKWRTTTTELRALIEENKEIKLHKPEFNILSKRLRSFPFIQISHIKKYPVFEITYDPNPTVGDSFGPFKNYETAELVLEIIYKKFRLKKCEKELDRKSPETNCLYFQTKQCLAPCLLNFNDDIYYSEIESVKKFLNNFEDGLLSTLETRMYEYSNNLQFELANQIKSQILEIKKILHFPKNGCSQLNQKNFIVINPINGSQNHELLFIKNGLLVWDTVINGSFNQDTIKKKIYEIYFNGSTSNDEFEPEEVEEIRLVLNWLNKNRNEVTIIEIKEEMDILNKTINFLPNP